MMVFNRTFHFVDQTKNLRKGLGEINGQNFLIYLSAKSGRLGGYNANVEDLDVLRNRNGIVHHATKSIEVDRIDKCVVALTINKSR